MNDPMRAAGLVECNVVCKTCLGRAQAEPSRAGATIRLHHGEVRSENPISISKRRVRNAHVGSNFRTRADR